MTQDDLIVEGCFEVIASPWLDNDLDHKSQQIRLEFNSDIMLIYGDGFRLMYVEFLNYQTI